MEQSSALVENAGMPEASDVQSMGTLTGSPQVTHSLMDVLRPASPPRPRNARIIRRFDLEAAKYDPQPEGESQPVMSAPAAEPKPAPQPTRTREEAKALRNRSLAAAAGFI